MGGAVTKDDLASVRTTASMDIFKDMPSLASDSDDEEQCSHKTSRPRCATASTAGKSTPVHTFAVAGIDTSHESAKDNRASVRMPACQMYHEASLKSCL